MKAKNNSVRSKEKGYEDLYICMYDAKEKRRHLLTGIATSLQMQEEYERVQEIRKDKSKIIKEIKRSLEDLNKNYQQLKKELPNVKNVITYTEKEIGELENQIHMLKEEKSIHERDISIDEDIKDKLVNSDKTLREITHTRTNRQTTTKPKHEPKKTTENLSKLDRIKNNLKVIESKLKEI